jgi:hypothetical protein
LEEVVPVRKKQEKAIVSVRFFVVALLAISASGISIFGIFKEVDSKTIEQLSRIGV